jgi:hypothetical protein
MPCTPHQKSFWWPNKKDRWAGHVARMGESRRACRLLVGKRQVRGPLGRPRLKWGIIIKWIFEKGAGGAWTGSNLLRVGTGGGILRMRWWTFGFHEVRGISWVAEDLLASQEGLCSVELVSRRFISLNQHWKRGCTLLPLFELPRNKSSHSCKRVLCPVKTVRYLLSFATQRSDHPSAVHS